MGCLIFVLLQMTDPLTLYVEVLSLVHQRHHLLGFGGHGLEPPQTSDLPFGLLGGRVSQQVVQVLGEVIGLWGRRRRMEKREERRRKEEETKR